MKYWTIAWKVVFPILSTQLFGYQTDEILDKIIGRLNDSAQHHGPCVASQVFLLFFSFIIFYITFFACPKYSARYALSPSFGISNDGVEISLRLNSTVTEVSSFPKSLRFAWQHASVTDRRADSRQKVSKKCKCFCRFFTPKTQSLRRLNFH